MVRGWSVFLSMAILCLVVFTLPSVSSEPEKLISNSADWKDVYSIMLFGSLEGKSVNFITSARHSTILLYSISKDIEVEVISSRRNAFVAGYSSIFEGRGYENVTEVIYQNVNLELADRLTGIRNFIIIDPSYGYNAISVGPYAVVSRSYVLFADDRTIGQVMDFLGGIDVDKVLLYGQLDRSVKDELARYNPEVINEGDRFDNNIAIVKKFQEIVNKKQAILTNGEFIEASLLTGAEPVIFIGRTNVPDQIRDYIKKSGIDVGVLIGNDLIGSATIIRRQLGISVFVKFAQGSRTPSGSIAPVEDLDRFPMPSYNLNLDIYAVAYNKGTSALEVTFHNLVDLATYFKSAISITDGADTIIIGDPEPLFIDGGEYKTVIYTESSDGSPLRFQNDELEAKVLTIFGEGKKSLEFTVEKTLRVESVTVLDDTDIEIMDLVYNRQKKQFEVQIENTGVVDVYTQVELVDLFVNGEAVTVASDGVTFLKKGEKKWIPVAIELAVEDVLDNEQVLVQAFYGAREISLVKVKVKSFAFREKGLDYVTYGLIILVVILLIAFIVLRKRRCPNCKAKNRKKATHCVKCGHPLKDVHRSQQSGH
ncbi:MAG: zinc ribbon domain-containing protein [Nanoarchaeota archaeon]